MPVAAIAVGASRGEWPGLTEVTPAEIWASRASALVPGFLAIMLYYPSIDEDPSSTATLAQELAFPVSALLLNWLVLGSTLEVGQVVGVVVLVATITAMGLAQARSPIRLGVRVKRMAATEGELIGARASGQVSDELLRTRDSMEA